MLDRALHYNLLSPRAAGRLRGLWPLIYTARMQVDAALADYLFFLSLHVVPPFVYKLLPEGMAVSTAMPPLTAPLGGVLRPLPQTKRPDLQLFNS